MCGIVGYIGNNAVDEILLSGLKSLEYRGYDSAGIALNDNQGIDVFRAKGKLQNLTEVIKAKHISNRQVSQGIGHIRWATHGEASIENAHPHLSNDGKLVLVHNGIIENYKELKDELIKQDYHFFSQTDTETIVHLIDREYKSISSLEQAVIRAISMLKGAFALCIMHHDEADKIIAVRKNAPLIIGVGKNENFIASDIPALIGKTQAIIHLEDNELAIVKKDSVVVKSFDGKILNKPVETVNIAQDAISKQGYKHFMIKEINEQPQIVRKMISAYMPSPQQSIRFANIDIEELIENIDKIEIIACGTSLHAAQVAQYMIEDLCNISVTVEAASEYIYKKHLTNNKTLSIGISQSGETADTITAIKQAKERGAKILILTNRSDSSIVRYAKYVLPLNAGIEVISGVLEDEAKFLNRIFIKNMTQNLPYVVLKTAVTLDGKIATKTGSSQWITSDGARTEAKKLRKKYDAILTSSKTVIADNPTMEHKNKIILDRKLKTDFRQANIYKSGNIYVFYDGKLTPPSDFQNIYFIPAPVIYEKLDIDFILKKLFELKIMSVFVEAGGILNGEMLNYTDKIYQFIAPKILSDNSGKSAFDGKNILNINEAAAFRFDDIKMFSPDILLTCYPINKKQNFS